MVQSVKIPHYPGYKSTVNPLIERNLSKAETDRYYSYAIYASRTLAVKHPEVYLQGNDIFAQVITTAPGFKQAYETKNIHSDYFMKLQLEGDSFSFDDVDFDKYELITSKEIYPPDYPFPPFFDRRMAPISVSLKTFDSKITQLEKAERLYFEAKHGGASDLFLLYCDNENAYLYQDGSLIWAESQEKVTSVEGNPVLIFNEQYVWYPLMERNDTDKSELLNKRLRSIQQQKRAASHNWWKFDLAISYPGVPSQSIPLSSQCFL